ncbi:hypothetical protein ACET3Z_030212 [Daucus carota]
MSIPQVTLSSGNAKTMPVLGLGTAADPFPGPETVVEMNPAWQQRKLMEFCNANGITIAAYSPLGGPGACWGSKGVLESEVLKEISTSKGKSVAQVALRWVYEQGVVIVMKSFNKERLKQNLEIFDWELTDEDSKRIAEIPQSRASLAEMFISETGLFKSLEQLWDGEQ